MILTERAFPERIAALVPSDGITGFGRQVTALTRGLQDTGIECLVIVFQRRGRSPSTFAQYLQEAGVAHRIVQDGGPLDWQMVSTMGTVLRRWRPSIVQTHGYKAAAVAYLLRRLGAPWPWVGCFHGFTTQPPFTTASIKQRFYHWADLRLLGAAERIVVMSRAQAHAFRHCRDRVRIIYNAALDTPPAGNPWERERLAAVAGSLRRPIVGVVGRLSPEKGVDLFLDACGVLVRKGLVFSALVAGDGPERARLEARCGQLGLESRVHFLGHVDNVDVVYRNLDLVVLPSRYEGLPNTLLEALRADVPAVATAVGAVPEVIGTSSAARVVAAGSAARLATAIEGAITQGDSPSAAAARREIVGRFSLERRLEAHLELYRELLQERTGATSVCVGSPAQ